MQQEAIKQTPLPGEDMPVRVLDEINIDLDSSDSQIILKENDSVFVDGVLRKELVQKSNLINQQCAFEDNDKDLVPSEFEILPSQIRAILHPPPPPKKEEPAAPVEEGPPPPPPTCKERIIGFFMKLEAIRLRIKAFRMGTVFFTYNTLGFIGIEKEFSPKKQKPSLLHTTKEYLTVILLVSVIYGIFARYQKLLGSEKSQGLKYKDMSNLTYPIESVPMLFPAHTFSFFQKEDVVNRILCKTYGDAKQCKLTEEARCRAKGITTQAYEICMVTLMNVLKLHSSQFCDNHYNTPDIWTEDLDPSKPMYYERKHQCYVYAGVPKGRAYCLDMYSHTPGWTKDNLFNCYIKNGVNSAKEQCQELFPIVEDDPEVDENAKKQLSCFGSKGVPQDKDYCDLKNRGEKRTDVYDRINCYDAIGFIDKEVCDTKMEFFNWDKEKLQKCYKAAGYVLNREFCNGFFIGAAQIDNRYSCYESIGLSGEKDRDYCDLLYEDDIQKKYSCMIKVNEIQIQKYQIQCEGELPDGSSADWESCVEGKKVENPLAKLGEDYCFATYMWENEFEELQDCLKVEGSPQESTYCDRKFAYLKYQSEFLLRDPSLYNVNDLYTCQEGYGIPNHDQTDNNCAYLALVKNDTIMVTTQIGIINEALDQFIGEDTLMKKLKFVGGALKLFYKDIPDQTAYIVFNADDASSLDSFGSLSLYLNAPRSNPSEDPNLQVHEDLPESIQPFKAEFLEGRDIAQWLIDSPKLQGKWHFESPNDIVIEIMERKKRYVFSYHPESGKHWFKDDKEQIEVDLSNSGNLQTIVVQNWQKSLRELFLDKPKMDCAFAYGDKSTKMATWGWHAKFDQSYTVQKIEVFNFKNGGRTSLLENAEIYVGDRLCAKIGSRPPVNQVVTISCQNPDQVPRNVFSKTYNKAESDITSIFDGTVGDSITIRSAKPGHQVICDLKVFAQAPDQSLTEKNAAGKATCKVWQDECRAISNPEDKYNCLERYGVPKTPQYCIDSLRTVNSQYPLMKKYQCMKNPKAKFTAVELHKNVTECLTIYFEKSTELCLENYERNFLQQLGFVGGNGTIEHPDYYKAYGNLTQDINDILAAEQIAKDKADFLIKSELATAAISDEVIIVDQNEIEEFMCKNSFFYFYTNPYDDQIQAPTKKQNEQYLDGQCQVFEFFDVVSGKNLSVLHWYMNDKNLNIRTEISDEKLKKSLIVNKTEMNNQYFRLEFFKGLEFLQTTKNQIYIRDQDPMNTEIELPLMSNEQDYYTFISENITQKIYETEHLVIAEQKVDPIILDTQPYQNTYFGMPVRFQKKFLGYLLKFNDVKEKVAIIKPENEVQVAKATDEDYQNEQVFPIHVKLRFDFTEMQFTFTYVQISDMISQLGGIMGIVMGLIGQFAVYLIIAYVIELLFLIKRKYKCDERNYVCETLKNRIPTYVRVVKELMQRSQGDPKRRNELKNDLRSLKEMMPELRPDLVDESEVSEDEELPQEQIVVQENKSMFAKGMSKLGEFTADIDDLYEDYKDRLLIFNKKYGNNCREVGIQHDVELFDEFDVIWRMLRNRVNTPILALIGRVKKNISFFGLYKLNDKIEFDIFRLENMKKKLQNTILMLLNYQNKLMANLNDSKSQNYDGIEEKFMDISNVQPRQTSRTRAEPKTQKEYEEMIVDIKNELFKLKMGIEDQNLRENKRLTEDKKQRIKFLRTELKRVMDTMLVQDISVKVHLRMQDMMKQFSKMDDKTVFSLEALCDFIQLNQYDSIVSTVRSIVDDVDLSEIEGIRSTVNELQMAAQNIQIKWMATDEILFNFIEKLQPNRISEVELCKVTQKMFAQINQKFVKINEALAQIYRDDCE